MALVSKATSLVPCTSGKREKRRVVLLGTSGHGKSALANFLYSLGLTQPNLAKNIVHRGKLPPAELQEKLRTSLGLPNVYFVSQGAVGGDSTTKECRSEKISAKSLIRGELPYDLEIFDTPGFDDPDPFKELTYVQNILEQLSRDPEIHAAILCVENKTRGSVSWSSSLQFYSKLFVNVFKKQQAFLVVTKVSNTHLLNLMQQEGNKKSEFTALSLSNVSKIVGHDIRGVLLIDSVPPIYKLEKGIRRIRERNSKYKMPDLALIAREHILQWIGSCKEPVNVLRERVPLPPPFEKLRVLRLSQIQGQLGELIGRHEEQKELISQFVSAMDEKKLQLDKKKVKREALQELEEKLSERQQSNVIFEGNSKIINFGSSLEKQLMCPIPDFTVVQQIHNCDVNVGDAKPTETGGRIIPVIITPNTFTFRADSSKDAPVSAMAKTWYARVHCEWDGRVSNATELLKVKLDIATLGGKIAILEKEILEITTKYASKNADVAAAKIRLDELLNEKSFLSREEFRIDENALRQFRDLIKYIPNDGKKDSEEETKENVPQAAKDLPE